MKSFLKIFLICLMLSSFIGCAATSEFCKKIWGSSNQALEEARKNGVSKTYSLDYETSFNKMIEVLRGMGCYIHIQDKKRHLIVAMNFQDYTNTTELGIFFIEKGAKSTEIELSSTSKSLLNYASERIFLRMDKN